MPRKHRARFVPLADLVAGRHPDLADADDAIAAGRVLVDGSAVVNPRAQVRADASVRLVSERRLRGEWKLAGALDALQVDVAGCVAVDVGAAAGGFTSALLQAGAARVYAVDVGFGQLRGNLRADPRVVNLERTNLADLDGVVVPEPVDVVTMDLSYLSVADAVGGLERLAFAAGARLLTLVKPTFELRSGTLAADAASVHEAIQLAVAAVERLPWQVVAVTVPHALGSRDAVEAFVLARRRAEPG